MKNIFDKEVTTATIARIQNLHPDCQPLWGKMEVAQMLAHCAVVYEMIFEDSLHKPKRLKKWLIKTFVKNTVVNERPYKKKAELHPSFW